MPLSKQSPGPPPRALPARMPQMAGALFLLLFGGIWAGVGLLVTTIFLLVGGGPWHDWILSERGVASTAEVVAVRQTHARINRRYVQEIEYQFADAHGALHPGKSGTIERSLIASANARQRLAVEYDPEYPARNRLAGTRVSLFGAFTAIPLMFAGVGSFLFLMGWRSVRRQRRLYRLGEIARGKVTKVTTVGTRRNLRTYYRVDYTFLTLAGPQSGSEILHEPATVGDEVWVIHDPNNTAYNLPALE